MLSNTDEIMEKNAGLIQVNLSDIESILERSKQELENNIKDTTSKLEKAQEDLKKYKDLDLECKKYLDQCIKESINTINWRKYLHFIILGYFIVINSCFYTKIDCSKDNLQLFLSIQLHNILILLVPLRYFFKSYGEKHKNNYFTPAINIAIATARRMLKLKDDKRCQ